MALKGWFCGQDRDIVQGLATLGNILFYWFLILDVIIVFLIWDTERIEIYHCYLQNCCFGILGEEGIICMYVCMYAYFFIVSGPLCTCHEICNHIQLQKSISMLLPWNQLYSTEFCFLQQKGHSRSLPNLISENTFPLSSLNMFLSLWHASFTQA